MIEIRYAFIDKVDKLDINVLPTEVIDHINSIKNALSQVAVRGRVEIVPVSNKYTVIILLLPPKGKSFLKKCRNGAKMPRIPQGMRGKSMDRDKNSGGQSPTALCCMARWPASRRFSRCLTVHR